MIIGRVNAVKEKLAPCLKIVRDSRDIRGLVSEMEEEGIFIKHDKEFNNKVGSQLYDQMRIRILKIYPLIEKFNSEIIRLEKEVTGTDIAILKTGKVKQSLCKFFKNPENEETFNEYIISKKNFLAAALPVDITLHIFNIIRKN